MSRKARPPIDSLPTEILEAAASEFLSCALKALEGQIENQRDLAARLGWPTSTLNSALKGGFTFSSWPKICCALGRDPIYELARGRVRLRAERDQQREESYRLMLERTEADTMVALWRKLSASEQLRVRELLNAEAPGGPST